VDRPDRTECFGKALTQAGWDAFGAVTPEALAEHDDDWLYDQMDRADYRETALENDDVRESSAQTLTKHARRPVHLSRSQDRPARS
jgi:hypothetical protein